MSGPGELFSTLPPFLRKLWLMVNDNSAEEIIGWNKAGDGFVIFDQVRFVMELLPTYFKHNNMASFVRQLNFYDFHKVADSCGGNVEFAHPYFLKDLPETLAFITRKPSNSLGPSRRLDGLEQLGTIADLLEDVKELKSKHHIVESEFQKLRRENAALWEEINSLRFKHTKQTKVIYKLIHFLVSYMHSDRSNVAGARETVAPGKPTLHSSPKLLQIDYKRRRRETIESLLEETSRDSHADYTVSYPPGAKEGPIEELSDTEADAGAYTVRFPKGKKTQEAFKPTDDIEKLLEPSPEDISGSAGDIEALLEPDGPIQVDLMRLDGTTFEPDQVIQPAQLLESDQVKTEVAPAELIEVPEPVPTFRIHQSAPGEYVLLPGKQVKPKVKVLKDIRVSSPGKRPSSGSSLRRGLSPNGGKSPKVGKASKVTETSRTAGKASSVTKPKRKPANEPVKASEPVKSSVPVKASKPVKASEPVKAIKPPDPQPEAIRTRPAQPRDLSPEWRSHEDPRQGLGSYLDSADSKLDGLRDILERLDGDVPGYFDDSDNLNLIRWELEDELARLPSSQASSDGDAAANLEALLNN